MKLKKDDQIKILAGKDKGKTGKVLQLLTSANKLVVDGLNLKYKHIRPKKAGEKGQRIMFPAPMNASNVMLICPKCNKTIRISYKVSTAKTETSREKKQRICRKCGVVL